MKKFLELEVRTAFIVHGFDDSNQEIVEEVNEPAYMKKLIALERIQSLSEQYILVTGSHGRVMYWEYKSTFESVKRQLAESELLLGSD